jgi:2-polyprenyl-3-methyl-5-hydroxy-6-metoxy-1,4-benzoquinol methylase
MERIKDCPICNSMSLSEFLICKDYTVSQRNFTISHCQNCGFKFTNPRPELKELSSFYESEEYISHSNSSKGLVNWLYQFVRKFTVMQKVKLLNKEIVRGLMKDNLQRTKFEADANEFKVLDIGCGTGEFLAACREAGYSVSGIEPSVKARKFAQEKYSLDVKDEQAINDLPSQLFHAVTLWHVLEHVPNLNERIQNIHNLLTEDGILIVAVPNPESKDAEIYGKYWAAYDVPRHLYHFSENSIKELMFKNNFIIYKTLPMHLDSFYVSLLSEKYKKGRINYLAALLNGLRSNFSGFFGKRGYSSQIYLFKKGGRP